MRLMLRKWQERRGDSRDRDSLEHRGFCGTGDTAGSVDRVGTGYWCLVD